MRKRIGYDIHLKFIDVRIEFISYIQSYPHTNTLTESRSIEVVEMSILLFHQPMASENMKALSLQVTSCQ